MRRKWQSVDCVVPELRTMCRTRTVLHIAS